MVIVFFYLPPVVAAGLRFSAQERSLTIGVLRPTRVMSTTLTTCTSMFITTMSFRAAATLGEVCGLSQNNKCSLTSIRVYVNGAKTERIKIFSGAF